MKSHNNFNGDLIGALIEEQQTLTAVERFSQQHASIRESNYSALIPVTTPKSGEQYSFHVDLKSCTGCKACVTACHSLNGLDEGESWRQTGALIGEKNSAAQQTITTACHHCLDPACMDGCPVLAYDKDPVTGIVRHLDDQCIGCQYCVLTCPYQVPQYSSKRGIVRKCDMCSQRLAQNEAPACVQACPNGAIEIRIVSQDVIRARAEKRVFIPDAPLPSRTFPTTTYSGTDVLPWLAKRADHKLLHPNQLHLPLVLMLILSQAAAGSLLFHVLFSGNLPPLLILFTATAGALASAFHLGRPAYGWRAFLGWRKSWLSREVIAYGVWLCLLLLCSTPFSTKPIELMAAAAGLATVYCSIRVYQKTGHKFWNSSATTTKFAGTTLLLGSALQSMGGIASIMAILKLTHEIVFLRHAYTKTFNERNRSAKLMTGSFQTVFWVRICFALLGIGAVVIQQPLAAIPFFVVSELCERVIFFGALAPDKMPGA